MDEPTLLLNEAIRVWQKADEATDPEERAQLRKWGDALQSGARAIRTLGDVRKALEPA